MSNPSNALAHHRPYLPGATLYIRLSNSFDEHDFSLTSLRSFSGNFGQPFTRTSQETSVTIKHVYFPFTLSATMEVAFEDPMARRERRAFLKLYDRRFINNTREEHKLPSWTCDSERDYQETLTNGILRERMRRRQAEEEGDFDPTDASGEHDWKQNFSEIETHLHYEALTLFDCELRAYRLLSHLQGSSIPRLYGTVAVCLHNQDQMPGYELMYQHTRSPTSTISPDCSAGLIQDISPFNCVPGILLEFVEGSFNLSELTTHVPQQDWQKVVDLATDAAATVAETGFSNIDFRPDNVLVQKKSHIPNDDALTTGKNHDYQCTIIDLAVGFFRRQGETDRELADRKSIGEVCGIYEAMKFSLQEILGEDAFPPIWETQWDVWARRFKEMEEADVQELWQLEARRAETEEEVLCSPPRLSKDEE